MAPLGEAVASVLLGESRVEVSDLISFNRTSQSFRNLMYGDCDILIVAEPAETVYDEMDRPASNTK
jgi:phosphate transport system substrate-binding protein